MRSAQPSPKRKDRPMTQADELREKVRAAVSRAWHMEMPLVIAQSTDAIMELMEQVRADERERLARR